MFLENDNIWRPAVIAKKKENVLNLTKMQVYSCGCLTCMYST